MVVVQRAAAPGASQLHTGRLFLEVKGLFQSKLERVSRMGGGSTGDASYVLVHKINGRRVFET